MGRFSDAWHGEGITTYARCATCINRWERWAEALTVSVYGYEYQNELGEEYWLDIDAVDAQTRRLHELINGAR